MQTGAMERAPTAVAVSAQAQDGTPEISNAAAAASAQSVRARSAPSAAIEAPQTVVPFPSMITAEMRRRLIALRYTPSAISRLNPQEAHDIINANRFAR